MKKTLFPAMIMEILEKIDTAIFGVRFSTLANMAINEAIAQKKRSRLNNYSTVVKSFLRFLGREDIRAKEITDSLLSDYRTWLTQTRKLKESTARCYLKNLKAILNKKYTTSYNEDEGWLKPRNSCRDSKLMALEREEIDKVLCYQPPKNTKEELAYDMFIFLMAAMGMPFVDLANLKKSDVGNANICYSRHKTNMPVCVPINIMAKNIINKYKRLSTNDYLFPIVKNGDDFDCEYRRMLDSVNYQLRKIGKKLGLSKPLTTYTARHTWASIAYDCGVNINSIAVCLGHANTNYTKAYIENMSKPREKSANNIVFAEIFGKIV